MNRAAVFAGALLLMAAVCLAQEPSPAPGTSSQNPSDQSSKQGSAGQKPTGPGSSGQTLPKQGSPAQAAPGQNASAPDSSAQVSSGSLADQVSEAEEPQESSSRDARTDISPPRDDVKEHPDSKEAVGDLEPAPAADTTDVQEFHPWNPMKAAKDVEVGDYYFKRKNYKAALDRYQEALYYKDKDAVATYRLAVCQEKLGDKGEARKSFEQYLKILPEGPMAKEARASLEKLGEKGNQ
jgi:tetratricopeptide (TPR) repeat protein